MEEVVKGIMLGGVNYGENDKILNVFTMEKGVVSARIKGVKKAGAKLKFCSEPFCFAEYVLFCSGEKSSVIGASLIDSFYPLRENLDKFYCASATAEFVRRFLKSGMVSPETFSLVCNTLKELAYGDEEPFSVCVKFFLSVLRLSGYGLNLDGCVSCGNEINERPFFDAESGGFFCEKCASGGREINYATLRALIKAENGERLGREEAKFALRLIEFYVGVKTEEKLTSLKQLIRLP